MQCTTTGITKGLHLTDRILVGRPEGRRLLGIPRRRWEDNIKMDLQAPRWDGVAWIDMAQDWDRSKYPEYQKLLKESQSHLTCYSAAPNIAQVKNSCSSADTFICIFAKLRP
jgi:hypothetical protein